MNSPQETVTLIYDDEQTDLQEISRALQQGGYPVKGEPQILERGEASPGSSGTRSGSP